MSQKWTVMWACCMPCCPVSKLTSLLLCQRFILGSMPQMAELRDKANSASWLCKRLPFHKSEESPVSLSSKWGSGSTVNELNINCKHSLGWGCRDAFKWSDTLLFCIWQRGTTTGQTSLQCDSTVIVQLCVQTCMKRVVCRFQLLCSPYILVSRSQMESFHFVTVCIHFIV